MLTWNAAGRDHATHPEISTPHTQKKRKQTVSSHTALCEKTKSQQSAQIGDFYPCLWSIYKLFEKKTLRLLEKLQIFEARVRESPGKTPCFCAVCVSLSEEISVSPLLLPSPEHGCVPRSKSEHPPYPCLPQTQTALHCCTLPRKVYTSLAQFGDSGSPAFIFIPGIKLKITWDNNIRYAIQPLQRLDSSQCKHLCMSQTWWPLGNHLDYLFYFIFLNQRFTQVLTHKSQYHKLIQWTNQKKKSKGC